MLLEACIICAHFYQTRKPNINVATRVSALATTAVKFGQQRLCFLNQSTNAICICLHKKISRFSNSHCRSTIISRDLLKYQHSCIIHLIYQTLVNYSSVFIHIEFSKHNKCTTTCYKSLIESISSQHIKQ